MAFSCSINKIALIGLRRESTIGLLLADRLSVDFLELDPEIAARAGMSIGEIFELWGEAHYRNLEDQVWRTRTVPNRWYWPLEV